MLRASLAVLVTLTLLHGAVSQPHRDFTPPGQQKKEAAADPLTQLGRALRGTLDSWLGRETMHWVSEVRKTRSAQAEGHSLAPGPLGWNPSV